MFGRNASSELSGDNIWLCQGRRGGEAAHLSAICKSIPALHERLSQGASEVLSYSEFPWLLKPVCLQQTHFMLLAACPPPTSFLLQLCWAGPGVSPGSPSQAPATSLCFQPWGFFKAG